MIDSKAIELMNLAIDGAISPAERATLDHYLSAHPDARSHYEALSRLAARLDDDAVPEPPAGLEARILDAVYHTPAVAPARQADRPTWLRSFLSPRLRPWSTFGLGLVAGVFLLAAVQYGRPDFRGAVRDIDPSHVSGSMVARVVEPIGSIPVETHEGTVSGSAVIYARGSDVVVEVKLQSTVSVEWTISYDPEAWTLDRVERRGTATSAFAANPGAVNGLHTGEGGVTLTFAGRPAAGKSVVLKVLQGGRVVFEGTPSSLD
jgi:hypothetical protein